FYLKRIAELSNRAIIEVRRSGTRDDTYKAAERVAELMENLAVLSTTLVLGKGVLLRKLAISPNIRPEIDFISDSKLYSIRSRSQKIPSAEGVVINKQFCGRFSKCGFFD